MNNENPLAPVNVRVHKLKAKLRPDNFEDRTKFKEMNLSHSLELAKTKAKMHNMRQVKLVKNPRSLINSLYIQ